VKSEALGSPRPTLRYDSGSVSPLARSASSPVRTNLFRFRSEAPGSPSAERFSPSPLSADSQRLLEAPKQSGERRRIPRAPFKVLEAPEIEDDFYLNLLDWSALNVIAVGLQGNVYLFNAQTSHVSQLCALPGGETVASVCWSADRPQVLAVGTSTGRLELWDAQRGACLRRLDGHRSRVGALAWLGSALTSGGRDRIILHRDTRTPAAAGVGGDGEPADGLVLRGHKQEVCGLRWSPLEEARLASGGNDNRLLVWDLRGGAGGPQQQHTRLGQHQAAVKALAWSPHQRGLLASGAGTADRGLRLWCTLGAEPACLQHLDTGSQICQLAFSRTTPNELVTTHGYSQNQICLWSVPSLAPLATLTGHTMRVLYLAMSPDGQTIVTGAGDETLRFWNLFPEARPSHLALSDLQLFKTARDIR
jgi:cell division cycle 20-like protein 1 (cofactor of APC complex)